MYLISREIHHRNADTLGFTDHGNVAPCANQCTRTKWHQKRTHLLAAAIILLLRRSRKRTAKWAFLNNELSDLLFLLVQNQVWLPWTIWKVAHFDWSISPSLAIWNGERRISRRRMTAKFNRRYLSCQISAILNPNCRDRRMTSPSVLLTLLGEHVSIWQTLYSR